MNPLRAVLLAASDSRWLRENAVRYGFARRAVSRFMPGETLDDALAASRALRVGTVLTHLGENLKSGAEAEQVARHYANALERIREESLDVEISVKLTQLGLDFSREDCERHLTALIERAAQLKNWIWIDMESSAYTEATLEVYRRARERFPNTGVCVQSYLYRTADDVEKLISLGAGVRLVKGAYREPPDKAFPEKRDVDASYDRLAARLLSPEARSKGVRAIFGTHDPERIGKIEELGRSEGLSPGSIEFQMLYGIRKQEQLRIANAGYRFRVLISYGSAWFAWYMRRLAERPANVIFVLRSLFPD